MTRLGDIRGVRLFFPLALGFAALSVPVWMFRYAGLLPQQAHLGGSAGHAHEMIFGYAAAAVAGFLTVGDQGRHVIALVLLWLAARLLILADAPPLLSAPVDLAFLPLLLLLRRPPIWSGAKLMSLGIAAVVVALSVVNAWIHLAASDPTRAVRTATMMLVVLMVVVAGRLVPGHTRAATRRGPGLALERTERASIAVAAALGLAVAVDVPAAAALLAAVLAALQAWRLWRWRDAAVLRDPLLWGLHLGFLWLTLGLAGLALAFAGAAPVGDALHLILVGGLGTLTLTIMMRLIRAQAGRRQTGGGPEAVVLALMTCAVLLRGILPLLAPQWRIEASAAAAGAWCGAMLLTLLLYGPLVFGGRPAPRAPASDHTPSERADEPAARGRKGVQPRRRFRV